MKIYFLGSISATEKLSSKYYKKIVDGLESMGHKVLQDKRINLDSVLNLTESDYKSFYDHMTQSIRTSDFVIAEVSHPTIKIGYGIALAVESDTPVLVLNSDVGEKSKFPLFLGYPKDKLILKDYNIDNIGEVIKEGVEEISQLMDIRFNFFISPKMSRFLEWISKDRMIPKAVFLRKLIEQEIDKAKDFSG